MRRHEKTFGFWILDFGLRLDNQSKIQNLKSKIGISLLTALISTVSFAVEVDFIREIKPLFADNCYKCHNATKRKGGLRLDNKADALHGGDNGPVFAAGKSAESLVIKR